MIVLAVSLSQCASFYAIKICKPTASCTICISYDLKQSRYTHTLIILSLQKLVSRFHMLRIGASLSEPHTSESLQNVRSTVSRNLVNHSVFGRTYVQQCHGIRYTSQDFVRSIVSRNSRSTVSRNLVNQSIFGCMYVQQCYGFRDTCQNIVN